jgi:hypothetical protein
MLIHRTPPYSLSKVVQHPHGTASLVQSEFIRQVYLHSELAWLLLLVSAEAAVVAVIPKHPGLGPHRHLYNSADHRSSPPEIPKPPKTILKPLFKIDTVALFNFAFRTLTAILVQMETKLTKPRT